MTYTSYSECDRCGIRDDPANRVFLLSVQDIVSFTVGHLCQQCARESMPRADWS